MRTKSVNKETSFNLDEFTKEEILEMFKDLPVPSLKRWLEYYAKREAYEACTVIKQIIDHKH